MEKNTFLIVVYTEASQTKAEVSSEVTLQTATSERIIRNRTNKHGQQAWGR